MHVTVLVLCVKHACFLEHAYTPCMFQETSMSHMHVSVNAPSIFSKYAESDAAMHISDGH